MIIGAGIVGIISYLSNGEFLFPAIGGAITAVGMSIYITIVLLLMIKWVDGSLMPRKSLMIALIGLFGAGIVGVISYWSIGIGEFLFPAIGGAIAAVGMSICITIMLLLMIKRVDGPLMPRKSLMIALIGLSCQLIPIAIASLVKVYSTEVPTREPDFLAWFLAVIFLSMVVPFLCVKRISPSQQQISISHHGRWVIGIMAALLVYGAVWSLGNRQQTRRLDRDCNAVIVWVKLGHPNPGCYLNLKLPPAFAHLSIDGLVDAAELKDGRLVLLFCTNIGWIGAWDGFIYGSGPLTPSEVGLNPPDPAFVNNWGYPPLRIVGLAGNATCVYKRVNPREYIVGYHN